MRYFDQLLRGVAAALLATALVLPASPAMAAAAKGDFVGTTKKAIAKALQEKGYRVREFEKEDGYLEVEASIGGKSYEIKVSPETGKIVKIERDD